jgi:hypothetical protein
MTDSNHELRLVPYCGMAAAKMVVIFAVFFPWLAIRLVLRKQSA